jgi:hypothetical protein
MSWQFTVGLRVKGKADRMIVDAEDALIAALKAKADQPGATIMYVRRSNRRGDTRHPLALTPRLLIVNGVHHSMIRRSTGQSSGRRLN